jgi:hypothetical protein
MRLSPSLIGQLVTKDVPPDSLCVIVYRDQLDGNGLVYRMNDLDSHGGVLERLSSVEEREPLGAVGAAKMLCDFSWLEHARRRLAEYEAPIELAEVRSA